MLDILVQRRRDKKAGLPLVTREFELTYPQPRVVRLYMVPFQQGEREEPRFAIILADITTEDIEALLGSLKRAGKRGTAQRSSAQPHRSFLAVPILCVKPAGR